MLQFITHTTNLLTYFDGAKLALEGGCKWIQLRMKDAQNDEIIALGRDLKTLCDEYGAHLIIDDHVELVEIIGAHGVHLGKNDMPVSQARAILSTKHTIGGTANTFEDVEALIAQGVDYIGLGPFRFTTTKQNLSATLGLEGYAEIMCQMREKGYTTPVVAIGGITFDDISTIMSTGVQGIALSGTVLNASDPTVECQRILQEISK